MARALHKWFLDIKRSQKNERAQEQNTDHLVSRSEIRARSAQVEKEFEPDHSAA